MSDERKLQGATLAIRYVPLHQVVLWDDNPKLHDTGGIINSIVKHGFRDAPIYDGTLGSLIAGNGRAIALSMMKSDGYAPPDGVAVDESGEWYLPVQFGVDAKSVEAAIAFGIDHNNLTLSGGDLTLFDMAKLWDEQGYMELVGRVAQAGDLLASMDMDDIDVLLRGHIIFDDAQADPIHDVGKDDMRNKGFRVTIRNNEFYAEAVQAVREFVLDHPEWQGEIS